MLAVLPRGRLSWTLLGNVSESLRFVAGSERYPELGHSQPTAGLRRSSNNRNNKENEFRERGSTAEGQGFPFRDAAVRKVSGKLGARPRVGPVGEAGRSSAWAERSGVLGGQANPVCSVPVRKTMALC